MFGKNKNDEYKESLKMVYMNPIFELSVYEKAEVNGVEVDGFKITLRQAIEGNVKVTILGPEYEKIDEKFYTVVFTKLNEIKDIIKKDKFIFDCNSDIDNETLNIMGYDLFISTPTRNRKIAFYTLDDTEEELNKKALFDIGEYMEQYKENLRQEAVVKEFLNKVFDVLKSEGIELSLNRFKTDKNEAKI